MLLIIHIYVKLGVTLFMKSLILSKKIKKVALGLLCGLCLCTAFGSVQTAITPVHTQAAKTSAYDISQWQGYISPRQAKKLKHEVHFMILRGEYGAKMQDTQLNHNAQLLDKYKIPYGAYDYSMYHNSIQAKQEAKDLINRAPYAKFYVNDAEQNSAGSRFNTATRTWAKTIQKKTHKPAILYSGVAFMNAHMNRSARHAYSAIWLAAYGPQPSSKKGSVNYYAHHYDLWQYSSNHSSRALRQKVDADVIPKHAKPLSFWTGQNTKKTVVHKAPQAKVLQPQVTFQN